MRSNEINTKALVGEERDRNELHEGDLAVDWLEGECLNSSSVVNIVHLLDTEKHRSK